LTLLAHYYDNIYTLDEVNKHTGR